MNERIRELAEQAGYTKDIFGIGHWDMPECKKFAELIVRECVGRVRYCIQNDLDYIAEDIEQHLGVKE